MFNGSSKTPSSVSLNDLLHVGPNLLRNPIDLICTWRRYKVALTADIEKMFRQIGLDVDDQEFQSILWRFRTDEPVRVYRLTTVTYGLSCSPFLAIRTLLQLAADHENAFPVAAKAVLEEMYSDNLLSGVHCTGEAAQKQEELIQLFAEGKFNLRKWASNEENALSSLSPNMLALDTVTLFASETSIPILGIAWLPKEDCFFFKVDDIKTAPPYTKRSVLSRIACTFDPLGWMSPVIITAKITMPSLWLLKIGWDETLPIDIT